VNHLIYAAAQEHVADLHREAEQGRTAALVRSSDGGGRRYRSTMVKHYRLAIAALTVAVAAVFATTAYAAPISNAGSYRDTSVSSGPVSASTASNGAPAVRPNPDEIGPGPRSLSPAQFAALTRPHPVVQVESSSGFDWGDAGIGAGAALAITAMGAGGLLLVSNRRSRRAAVAG
jgi:hypothetical protein